MKFISVKHFFLKPAHLRCTKTVAAGEGIPLICIYLYFKMKEEHNIIINSDISGLVWFELHKIKLIHRDNPLKISSK